VVTPEDAGSDTPCEKAFSSTIYLIELKHRTKEISNQPSIVNCDGFCTKDEMKKAC
jgi:hypothetical protein